MPDRLKVCRSSLDAGNVPPRRAARYRGVDLAARSDSRYGLGNVRVVANLDLIPD